jgi:serine/threonine protein kinase
MGEPRARTPRYAAPEVERWDLRGWRSDVYSLGCVFLEICTALAGKSGEDIAEYLGTDEEDLIFQEHHEKALEWTQTLSGVHGRESNDLLALPIRWTSRMLQYRPSHRPYMTDVLDMMGKDTRPMKHRRSIFFCSICQAELKTRNDITAEGTDLDDDSRSDLGDDHDDGKSLLCELLLSTDSLLYRVRRSS